MDRYWKLAAVFCAWLLLFGFFGVVSAAVACSPAVQIIGDSYQPTSLQDAYDYASQSLGLDTFTLRLSAEIFTEDLILDGGSVLLEGGYDCSFSSQSATSDIFGQVTIRGGTAAFSAIKIISTDRCDFDVDMDGFTVIGSCLGSADDCNDRDAAINPEAAELCDGIDNNCNGLVDEGFIPSDADGDGYYGPASCGAVADDCNDGDSNIHPAALEIPYDGIDQDCNGSDLTFAEDNYCVYCHLDIGSWTGLHAGVAPPDASCAICHAASVANVLSGHYGQRVRTAGNNMDAGELIDCRSCHDQVDYLHSFGANQVWPKVTAAQPNVSCDTCHDARAALHQSENAHDQRSIDSFCGLCHTSDTTQLGQPGAGSLRSADDVDILHRADCALCHAYTGTLLDAGLVRQQIQQGVGGSPVACTDCHATKLSNHGSFEHPVALGPNDLAFTAPAQPCSDCHRVANWAEIEGLHEVATNGAGACATCHNSTRQEVVDTIAAKADPTHCRDCHVVSHVALPNVDHVASGYVTAVTPCLNCHAPGAETNGTVSAVHNNKCALCHSSVPNLQAGLPLAGDCTDCHGSDWGSIHTIACLSCHDQLQDNQDGLPAGGRRAVAGEFPSGTSHAHLADAAAINNNDCQVCHALSGHSDGKIRLLDADSGSLYVFQHPSDLNSDPDLSDFCLSCHDADGAMRLPVPLDPFANGNRPPDTASRFQGSLSWNEYYGDFCFGWEGSQRYVNSHHDISDSDQASSGAKLECLNCHSAHAAAASQKLADPFNPLNVWSGSNNAFCLSCHNGGSDVFNPPLPNGVEMGKISADIDEDGTNELVSALGGMDSCSYYSNPWWVGIRVPETAHMDGSKRSWAGYSGAPEYQLDCIVCHDPHGSWSVNNPAGNPYAIRDYVDGTAYVDDGARSTGFNGPPWTLYGSQREVILTPDATPGSENLDLRNLCVTCHADWQPAYDWHGDLCNACLTCHSHGAAFDSNDFGPAPDDTPWCP